MCIVYLEAGAIVVLADGAAHDERDRQRRVGRLLAGRRLDEVSACIALEEAMSWLPPTSW